MQEVPEDRRAERLKEIDKDISNPHKGVIFRYFYDRFEGLQGKELMEAVSAAWKEVMETFRRLDDWYWTPMIYNYIGLLSQLDDDIVNHIIYYEKCLDDSSTQQDFIEYLKGRIRYHLRNVEKGDDGIINLSYEKQRNLVYRCLLTLNVHLVNLQNKNFNSSSEVYKFPFDVLNEQNWDIEHIDSYSTNKLKKESEMIEWIKTAREDLKNELSEEDKLKLTYLANSKSYKEAIHYLKEKGHEEDQDDETKNKMWNLTLLDNKTNRSYGNSLFCRKRRIIIERMKDGVYIPIGTQYVFSKLFDNTGTNRSTWSTADMTEYGKHITKMLDEYITPDK